MNKRITRGGLLVGLAAVLAMTVTPAAAGSGCTGFFTGGSSSCTFNLGGSRLVLSAYAQVTGPTATITVTVTGPSGVTLATCTATGNNPGAGSTTVGCWDALGVQGLSTSGLASLTCAVSVSPPQAAYASYGCQSSGA